MGMLAIVRTVACCILEFDWHLFSLCHVSSADVLRDLIASRRGLSSGSQRWPIIVF